MPTPWIGRDADKFCPHLDDAGRAKWVNVAMAVEEQCEDDGGTERRCAAKARRAATDACRKDSRVRRPDEEQKPLRALEADLRRLEREDEGQQ